MPQTPSENRRFRVDADTALALAEQFGTPLYVIDEAHLRARIREYRDAFAAAFPKTELSYASKANSCLAVLAIAHEEDCWIDVASEGELRAAVAAGVPPSHCHFHGNNKLHSEIENALAMGIGAVVADHFGELEMLAELGTALPARIILRLAPGVDPKTHSKISTGQADTKFGFNIADGSAERANLRCLELGLPLVGFHCHVGSQLLDPEAQESGGELIAQFASEMFAKHGFRAQYLNAGGGLGIAYGNGDNPMPLDDYCRLIGEAVAKGLGNSGLDPVLGQEPGRSIIAESGLTLYRVGVVKTVPISADKNRTYVCVDGGLSDNPRPAMYGSRYPVEAFAQSPSAKTQTVTVSGRHCETDMLFPDVEMPTTIAPGDLVQVLCTGAYNASMASNYNRFPRPATVLMRENGEMVLIQRRETWEELLSREILPNGLTS